MYESSDAKERLRLVDLLLPVDVSYYRMTNISENENGSYSLTLVPTSSLIRTLAKVGISTKDIKIEMLVFISDGLVNSYELTITSNGYGSGVGNSVFFYPGADIKTTCDFN